MNSEIEIKSGTTRQTIEVFDPIPLLSTGHFEQMQRLATLLAESTLIPDSLRMTVALNEDGWPIQRNGKNVMVELPHRTIIANCFLVVEQAVRWGMSPFGVAQCVSVVYGRLCYEGKLVSGVLDAKLGIELDYEWNDLKGDDFGIKVSGRLTKRGELKSIKGTVGEWKTTGANSPWAKPANHARMLAYRGAREWSRIFKSSLMLGVYTPDEMDALEARPRSIAPVQHALGKPNTESLRDNSATDAIAIPEARAEQGSPLHEERVQHERPGAAAVSPSEEPGRPPEEEAEPPSAAMEPNSSLYSSLLGFGLTDLPEPHDDASYQAHVCAWVALAENRRDAAAQWSKERPLRARLGISMEVANKCKGLVEATFPKERSE